MSVRKIFDNAISVWDLGKRSLLALNGDLRKWCGEAL